MNRPWEFVFDQPKSLTYGVKRHALRVFVKYEEGEHDPEPDDVNELFALKYVSQGKKGNIHWWAMVGHMNESMRSAFNISSCCFRDDCAVNNAGMCPFKRALFVKLEIPEPMPQQAHPSAASQQKKRERAAAQNAEWKEVSRRSEEAVKLSERKPRETCVNGI